VSVLAEFGRADAALAELCLGRLAEPSMIAGTRSACGGAGRALDGLVASLRAHSGVAAVQAYGCRALRSVALGASAIQQAAVAAGGAGVRVALGRGTHRPPAGGLRLDARDSGVSWVRRYRINDDA